MLRVLEESFPKTENSTVIVWRDTYDELAMIRSSLARQFFKIDTVSSLLNQLLSDSTLRQIYSFTKGPSEPTFSRKFSYNA